MDYEDEDGLSKLLNMDMSGLSFDGVDLSALEGMDLSGLNNLDLSGLLDVDMSGLSFADSLDDMDTRMGDANLGVVVGGPIDGDKNELSAGDFDQAAPPANIAKLMESMSSAEPPPFSASLLTPDGVDESFTGNLSEDEYNRYLKTLDSDYKSPLSDLPAQQMQITPENQKSFDDNLTDIMKNRGGFTSQWQRVGTDRVMVNDDGTGIGINENGDPYALTAGQVNSMIKNGQLNTFKSGYNTATGGNEKGPGGSTAGKSGTPGKDSSGNKSSTGDKKNDLSYLLPLLLAMMAMNRGGGSSSSGAVIPSLSADRKQLPYGPSSGEVKRPGAGGTTYFSPTTYTKKAAGGGMMYGGGGISNLGGYSDGGRLLRGPGDGVSDSIPATIGGKQPARLATGEFVVPARIVSELGNGSTEAGAKKLYAMMDRVQKARRKTKNVAADTKAHKYLPA